MNAVADTQTTFPRHAAAVVFGCIALLHAACAVARPAEPFGFETVARIAQDLAPPPSRVNGDNPDNSAALPALLALPVELRAFLQNINLTVSET